MVAYTKVTDI